MPSDYATAKIQTALEESMAICSALETEFQSKQKLLKALHEKLQFEYLYMETSSDIQLALEHTRSWELIDKLQIFLKNTINSLNKTSSNSFSQIKRFENEKKETERMTEILDVGVDGITAYYEAKRVYIHTPILDTKKAVFGQEDKKNTFLTLPNPLYQQAVANAMDKLILTSDFLPQAYEYKSVFFLFSHGDKTGLFPDNDKYDIEQVLNGIVSRTFAGDSPTHCQIILDSLEPKTLPEGTYITLSPQSEPIPGKREIIEFWNNHLPTSFDFEEFKKSIVVNT